MRAQFASLAKQTVIYGLSQAVLPVVGLLTVPIFARTFSPAEFGVLEIATVLYAVLLIVVDFGMQSASQRSYYDYSEEEAQERRTVLATAFAFSLSISISVAALLALAREPVAEALFDGQGYDTLIALVALAMPLFTLAAMAREVMRLELRPWPFTISASIAAAVGGGVGVYLVLGPEKGLDGVLAGIAIGNACSAVFGVALVYRAIGTRFSVPELRTMLAFGVPLIPAGLAMWALQFVDRVMLARLDDLAEVGEYAVANRVALVLMLGVMALATAYSPFVLSQFNEDPEHEKRMRGRLLPIVTAGFAVGAVFLSLFAREMIEVIAPDFDRAYQAVPLVSIGLIAYGISNVAMAGISLARATRWFAIYALVAAVVNIGLNFIFIPWWGQIGAAAATAIAYSMLTGLIYRKAQQVYPTPYQGRQALTFFVLGSAACCFGLIDIEPVGVALAVKAGIFLAFCALVGALARMWR